MTTLSYMWFKMKIYIGATALCLLYGRDIYNADSDTVRPISPDVISAHVTHYLHQIGR
jgi:hypothetical protein